MQSMPPAPSVDGMLHRSGGWWQSGSSPHDDLQTLLRLTNHSQSIAVVGASGNLLHRAYGADIDAHDIVIRVNQAPAWPPEAVGRRSTLRVLHQVAFQQTSGVLQPGEAIVWTGTHLGVDGSPPEWPDPPKVHSYACLASGVPAPVCACRPRSACGSCLSSCGHLNLAWVLAQTNAGTQRWTRMEVARRGAPAHAALVCR